MVRRKRALQAIIFILLLAALLLSAVLLMRNDNEAQSSSSQPQVANDTPLPAEADPSETITKVGTIGCLEPKDNAGQQLTICSIGLKTDDGTSYALNADDPTTTGSIPTGTRVEVIGTLTQQTMTYDAVGVIQVVSIKRL